MKAEPSQAGQLFGKYPGTVLDNATSGARRGELLVELGGLTEETDDTGALRPMQVVARPCLPPGYLRLPAVGAHVWVEFAAGQPDHAIWTGVWYAEGEADADWAAQPAARTVICDEQGNRVELGPEGLVFQGGGVRVSLTALRDWLLNHKHLGNMGGPTELMPNDGLTIQTWLASPDEP